MFVVDPCDVSHPREHARPFLLGLARTQDCYCTEPHCSQHQHQEREARCCNDDENVFFLMLFDFDSVCVWLRLVGPWNSKSEHGGCLFPSPIRLSMHYCTLLHSSVCSIIHPSVHSPRLTWLCSSDLACRLDDMILVPVNLLYTLIHQRMFTGLVFLDVQRNSNRG